MTNCHITLSRGKQEELGLVTQGIITVSKGDDKTLGKFKVDPKLLYENSKGVSRDTSTYDVLWCDKEVEIGKDTGIIIDATSNPDK